MTYSMKYTYSIVICREREKIWAIELNRIRVRFARN